MDKQHRLFSVAILAAAIVVGGLVSAQASPRQGGNNSGSVAVLDLNQVLQEADERERIVASLNEMQTEFANQARQRQNRLEQIENDLRVLRPGDPEYDELVSNRLQLQIELQHRQQYWQRKLNTEMIRQYDRLYRRVVRVAGRIAEEQGYDVVLLKDPDRQFPHNIEPQQFLELLGQRKMLWSSGEADLTAATLARLNQ